jgi:molecular chaperone DnaK (HSP70)
VSDEQVSDEQVSDTQKPRATRYAVWFPIRMEADGDVVLSITRDVSASGVLVVAAAELKVGSSVEVTLAVPNDDKERVIQGTIVRVEPNDADAEGLWRHKVAVAFIEKVEQLDDVLEELERTSMVPTAP